MLNCSKEEAEKFITENTGKMTTKEMGLALGVSGARISQMRGEMKGPATIPESVETALAPDVIFDPS